MEKTLKEIIKESPNSSDFKPFRAGSKSIGIKGKNLRPGLSGDAGNKLFTFEHDFAGIKKRNSQLYNELLSAEDKGFIDIRENKVYLLPVKPKTNYDLLVHKGVIVNGSNNIENLLTYGVFGSPQINFPTYMMTFGSNICTGNDSVRNYQNSVTLFINLKKLLSKRSVFIDPETIGHDGNNLIGDVEGESFFVLGGIPKDSIVEYRYKGDTFKI